jgi:hypothetical protein
MENKQLYLITFEYNNAKCYLPQIFNNENWETDKKIEFCKKIIENLSENNLITKLNVMLVRVGTYNEMFEDFLKILNAPNPQIKYLKIAERKFYDKKYIPEMNSQHYTKMIFRDEELPIRVINKETGLEENEDFLPLIIIEEYID